MRNVDEKLPTEKPGALKHAPAVLLNYRISMLPELVLSSTKGPPAPTFPRSSRGLMLPCTLISCEVSMLPELLRATRLNAACDGKFTRTLPEPLCSRQSPVG